MSGTKRTPIARQATLQITPRVVELFELAERARRQRKTASCVVGTYGLCRAECPACTRWYDAMAALHSELRLRPWQWPCLPLCSHPPGTPAARDWRPDSESLKLWLLLDQARSAE
jgi:hypothetical protein